MMVSLEDVAMLFNLPLGVSRWAYWHPQHLATGLPLSVRKCSSKQSRASALLVVRGCAWTHHDLVAPVQCTCFYLIFFILCMYLKQMWWLSFLCRLITWWTMLSQEQSQVSGGVPALVGRLHDVLRVCWRRNVQVLDPLLSDDCRRTPVRSAPDELGQHCFFGDVHGVVYACRRGSWRSSLVVLSFYSFGSTSASTSIGRRPTSPSTTRCKMTLTPQTVTRWVVPLEGKSHWLSFSSCNYHFQHN
jgi:hypothetical protein